MRKINTLDDLNIPYKYKWFLEGIDLSGLF